MAFQRRSGNSLLFGRKEPVFKFVKIGDEVTGDVIEVTDKQRRAFVNGQQGDPIWWMKGETGMRPVAMPKDQAEKLDLQPLHDAVIRLQTRLKDEVGDTGVRRLILENREMKDAVVNAVENTDAPELEEGGRLTVRYAKNFADNARPAEKGNRKMFEAVYTPEAENTDKIATKAKPTPAMVPAGEIPLPPEPNDPWQ